ncbi:MAG TPA: hypothetical protein EYO33_04140 [Phycisphaerales bacterium]|nr:hypothetical protein [Phycisphaerales bacterium]
MLMHRLAVWALVLALLLGQPAQAEPEDLLKACQVNLTNSAQALEAYARDHNGRLPQDLRELTPTYSPGLRVCPVSLVPYRYRKSEEGKFELICAGDIHSDLSKPGRGDIAYQRNTGIIWPYSASPLSPRHQKNWRKRQKNLSQKRLYETYLPGVTAVLVLIGLVLGLALLFFRKSR